jgi:hypothetical protein
MSSTLRRTVLATAALIGVATCCGCELTTASTTRPPGETAELPLERSWTYTDLDGDDYIDHPGYEGPAARTERSGTTIDLRHSKLTPWSAESSLPYGAMISGCNVKTAGSGATGTAEYLATYIHGPPLPSSDSPPMPVTFIWFDSEPYEGSGRILAVQDAVLPPGAESCESTIALPRSLAQPFAGVLARADAVTTLRLLSGRIPEYARRSCEYQFTDSEGNSYTYESCPHLSMCSDYGVIRKEFRKLRPGRYRYEFLLEQDTYPASVTVVLFDSRGWAVGQHRIESGSTVVKGRGQIDTVGEAEYMGVYMEWEGGC